MTDIIKNATRVNRAGKDGTRKHQLSLHTPLPTQRVVLNVAHNKRQVIEMLIQYLIENVHNTNELVITCAQPDPVTLQAGKVSIRHDLHNTHEEADVMIINQLLVLVNGGVSHIRVICDDTDVFILLTYYYCREALTCDIIIESHVAGRNVVDIKATAACNLPAVHALTGCDTTSYFCGIGKSTALKFLKRGFSLHLLGVSDAAMDDVVNEANNFVVACYGSKNICSISEVRYDIWSSKMANPKITSAPKLKSLPPTSDALLEHVYRAHYQTMVWKSADLQQPPDLNPTPYGWARNSNDTLISVMLPSDVSPAPVEVLQLIKCGCAAARPCSSGRCSCVAAQMSCSMFCKCHAYLVCNNEHTPHIRADVGDEDDEEGND